MNALQHNQQMTHWEHTLLLMKGEVFIVQAYLTKVSVAQIMCIVLNDKGDQ